MDEQLFFSLDGSEEEHEEIIGPTRLDQLISVDDSRVEAREETSAYIALLKGAIPAGDVVLHDYVEIVGPQMQKEFSLRPAKGSADSRYSHNADQSMLAHILNGIFPTLQIVRESGAE